MPICDRHFKNWPSLLNRHKTVVWMRTEIKKLKKTVCSFLEEKSKMATGFIMPICGRHFKNWLSLLNRYKTVIKSPTGEAETRFNSKLILRFDIRERNHEYMVNGYKSNVHVSK